jgi:tRNA 2-thiouridine synthesizing protein A
MKCDDTLDTRGLRCPMPILATKTAIAKMTDGQVLTVLASDPGSLTDMTSFCQVTGNELLIAKDSDGSFEFTVRKNSVRRDS